MIQDIYIRQALVERLKGKTKAGDKVTASSSVPWRQNDDAPGIAIYQTGGDPTPDGSRTHGRRTLWKLEIAIETYVRREASQAGESGEPDYQASILQEQIMQLLEADPYLAIPTDKITWGGEPQWGRWDVEFDSQGNKLSGFSRLIVTYAIVRQERRGDPNSIAALETLATDWDLISQGQPIGAPVDAEDTLELPQE